MNYRVALILPLFAVLGGCAKTYSAERAGVPEYVFRGYHLECVKQAQAHGGYRGQTDANLTEQGAALGLGGVVGLAAYHLAEPDAKNNPTYRQCMADNGVAPRS
jgi:hypothetical protein